MQLNTTEQQTMSNSQFFKLLTEDQRTFFQSRAVVQQFEKSTKIFQTNDPTKFVYLLLSGQVKLANGPDEERTIVKQLIFQGEIFGEQVFAKNAVRGEYAECIGAVRVLAIRSEDFMSMVAQNHKLIQYVSGLIVLRLKELQNRVQNFVVMPARDRIIYHLLQVARRAGITIGQEERLITAGVSPKDIASMTDTSRQTVARVLSKLQSEGLIYFSKRNANKLLVKDIFKIEQYMTQAYAI